MKYPVLLLTTLALAGCTSSQESDPAYVSPSHYDSYSCSQMKAEMKRVSGQIDQFSQQNNNAGNQVLTAAVTVFAISRGYGFQEEDNVELRRAQNKYYLLDEQMIKKDCIK